MFVTGRAESLIDSALEICYPCSQFGGIVPAKHLCVGSLALNDTVLCGWPHQYGRPWRNALYAAAGANIWSNQVGIVAVVGYDWPASYTDTLHHSDINTSGLVQKDAETMRAWTIYEMSGYRRYFSRNTELVLLTPSPYRSTPLTTEEIAAYSEAARQVHMRSSPLPRSCQTICGRSIRFICLPCG